MSENNYRAWNQKAWDHRTEVHVESKFYDLAGFKAGATSLQSIELKLLPQVAGKKLLHLQCHFGLDTMSWSRLGAQAIGVDFSPTAITWARKIAAELGLDSRFECADVLDLGGLNLEPQDLVFSSYGVLLWLPDLAAWARSVASSLRPGGELCLVEFHPIHDFIAGYPYFGANTAIVEEEGTYTENCPGEKSTMATWSHPISAVMNALIRAGMRIDRVEEYPFSPYNCFAGLQESRPGAFTMKHGEHEMPLVFSLQATKT